MKKEGTKVCVKTGRGQKVTTIIQDQSRVPPSPPECQHPVGELLGGCRTIKKGVFKGGVDSLPTSCKSFGHSKVRNNSLNQTALQQHREGSTSCSHMQVGAPQQAR